ncbi:hypothetical protein [Nocardia jiangsuensis]|uniref:Carbon monoxide dehydrogenase subunit G n=1 Tax=Nocardia jiangsuensis TaxID=1691563 RepID=A0ABV8E175_9NOCA
MDEYARTVSADRLDEITRLAATVAPVLLQRGVPFDVTLPDGGPLGWYLRSYRVMRGTEREGKTTWEWTDISVLGQDGILYTARREDEMQTFTTYQVGRDELVATGRLGTTDAVFSLERNRMNGEAVGGSTAFGRTLLDDLHQLAAARSTQPRRSMIPPPKPAPAPAPVPRTRFGCGSAFLIMVASFILAVVVWLVVGFSLLSLVVLVVGLVYAVVRGLAQKSRRGPR